MMPPKKNTTERLGWKLMLAGFAFLLLACAAYFMAPRSTDGDYASIGNTLMFAGLAAYFAGRVFQYRGRRQRRREEEEAERNAPR